MVLCEICDKPISAHHISNVLKHYRERHPNAGRPPKLLSLLRNARKSTQGRPTENVSLIGNLFQCILLLRFILIQNFVNFDFSQTPDGSGSENDEENDLIILEGCGQRTEYHFPKETTACPIYTCRKDFGIRALAIDHFKLQHSKHSIFCEVCQKVVKAKSPASFLSHHKNMHPHVEPPEFLTKPIPKQVEVRNFFLFFVKIYFFINFYTTE